MKFLNLGIFNKLRAETPAADSARDLNGTRKGSIHDECWQKIWIVYKTGRLTKLRLVKSQDFCDTVQMATCWRSHVLLLIRPKYAIPNNESFFLFAFHWRDSADSWHSPTVSLIVYRLLLSRVELQAAWTQSITGVSWAHNMYIKAAGGRNTFIPLCLQFMPWVFWHCDNEIS